MFDSLYLPIGFSKSSILANINGLVSIARSSGGLVPIADILNGTPCFSRFSHNSLFYVFNFLLSEVHISLNTTDGVSIAELVHIALQFTQAEVSIFGAIS